MDRERDFFENSIFSIVREGDTMKFDVTSDLTLFRGQGFVNLLILVEQSKNPFQGGHGRLQNIIFLREVPNRLEEHSDIRKKGDERPKADRLLNHLPSSVPEEETNGPGAQYFHEGNKEGIDGNSSHIGKVSPLIYLLKSPAILFLPSKELNNPDA